MDKKKLKQGTRVALDMTTLTIMRFVLLYLIVGTFHMIKSAGTFHIGLKGLGNAISLEIVGKIRKSVKFLKYKPFNQTCSGLKKKLEFQLVFGKRSSQILLSPGKT